MKKTVFSLCALLAASLLLGCHGESVTGPPMGPTALTGQVFPIGNLAGASPAGISVTCSGQVSMTDAAGRFAFVSVSSSSPGRLSALSTGNFNMHFTRADGIDASGSVSSSSSDVVVYLQKSQAQIVSTGQAKQEIEGLITKISSSSITVNDASTHGPVTASINASTVITKGNQTVSADSLNVGDQVHVKATVNSDHSLTAFEIIVQNSGNNTGGGQTQELEGPITKISATSITVNNASTGGPVTAAITSATVIRKGNTTLTTNDLHVGDRVHVKTTGSGDSLSATEILLQNPA
jgi:hypothetical protein